MSRAAISKQPQLNMVICPILECSHHITTSQFICIASPLTDIATFTAQEMKFSIKDFFSKCDQIHSFLRIWSHLLKKSLMETFIFCAVIGVTWVIDS